MLDLNVQMGIPPFPFINQKKKLKDTTWLYFETEALKEDVEKLQESGIEFESLPIKESWLWEESRFKDLDGNQLILYHAGKNTKNPPWRIK